MESSTNNKRIAKNTIMLYLRTILTMIISLYTSRVILKSLGVVDYGIYSVVGGFVAMFSVISNSLTAAITRYITYELGKSDNTRLNLIFCISVKTQIYLSIVILILAETIGLWFLNTQMVFPADRMNAVNLVFQLSVLTFIVNLISVPYNACIIAHEHLKSFAYFGILQSLLSLSVALLINVSTGDKLILYSVMMTIIAILIRYIYSRYCNRHFDECRFSWKSDRFLTKEIAGFAGWNFIGAASGVLRDQGVNIVLNIFCGPAINAARGIAMQVSSAVSSFSTNFTTAINPQITKSYAINDRGNTMNLVFKGARLSFYLLFIMSLPVILEAPYILKLWLGECPEHTVNFVRLILIYILTESVSYTMVTLMLATGNIKKYQVVVGGFQMLNLPVAYTLMRMGYPPESTIIASIAISLICLVARLYMLREMVQLHISQFVKKVLLNVFLVGILSGIMPLLIVYYFDIGFVRFVINSLVCILSTITIILCIGCTAEERAFLYRKIKFYILKK